jgi:hypothetical protein
MFGARRLSLNRYGLGCRIDAQRWADLFSSQFSVLRKTVELTSRRSVGIDAALDLGDAFVVAVNHGRDRDRAAYEDGDDRDQKRAQAYDGIEDSIHSPPPASGAKALFLFLGP